MTTALASAVLHAVSIRMPASLSPSSSNVVRPLQRDLAGRGERQRAQPVDQCGTDARLRPANPSSGHGSTHAIENSSALPGSAYHVRPRRPRPAVCRYATRTTGRVSAPASRGKVFRWASRSALVEPVSSTISIGQSCAAEPNSATARVRSMPPVAGGTCGSGWEGGIHGPYCSDGAYQAAQTRCVRYNAPDSFREHSREP